MCAAEPAQPYGCQRHRLGDPAPGGACAQVMLCDLNCPLPDDPDPPIWRVDPGRRQAGQGAPERTICRRDAALLSRDEQARGGVLPWRAMRLLAMPALGFDDGSDQAEPALPKARSRAWSRLSAMPWA
jgi:hypothetical protein